MAVLLLPHPGRSPHPCGPPLLLVAHAYGPKPHRDKDNKKNAARSAVCSKTAPQSPGQAGTSWRHGWHRQSKIATLAVAVSCLEKSCLTILNGRSRYPQRLALCLIQRRARQSQWENCPTRGGVEVGPGSFGLVVSDRRLQPFTFVQVEAIQKDQPFLGRDSQAPTTLPVLGRAQDWTVYGPWNL
jgi:hypothetical protein